MFGRYLIRAADPFVPARLQSLWQHEAGPKTVFFWAPTFKWALVFAGIADLARPADRLSVTQSAALAATGVIWARYSMAIIPKNWNLFSVNVFLGSTAVMQLSRIAKYHYEKKQNGKQSESS